MPVKHQAGFFPLEKTSCLIEMKNLSCACALANR
jgi:hypothetical protein